MLNLDKKPRSMYICWRSTSISGSSHCQLSNVGFRKYCRTSSVIWTWLKQKMPSILTNTFNIKPINNIVNNVYQALFILSLSDQVFWTFIIASIVQCHSKFSYVSIYIESLMLLYCLSFFMLMLFNVNLTLCWYFTMFILSYVDAFAMFILSYVDAFRCLFYLMLMLLQCLSFLMLMLFSRFILPYVDAFAMLILPYFDAIQCLSYLALLLYDVYLTLLWCITMFTLAYGDALQCLSHLILMFLQCLSYILLMFLCCLSYLISML